jgi:hypothetical protein
MLNITIGQTPAPTQNVDIPIVLRNPVFFNDEGNIPGSFIFNFTLPLTDEIKKELSFAHRPSRKGKPTWQHPCQVRFGPLHYIGTATITQTTTQHPTSAGAEPETIEVSMPVETASIAPALKENTLHDLDITETIQQIECNYGSVIEGYDYEGPLVTMDGPYTENIYLDPNLFNIKTIDIYDPAEKEWVIPETGNYNLFVSIRSSFEEVDVFGGNIWTKGAFRVFRIWKNDVIIYEDFFENIEPYYDPVNNFYFYKNVFSFDEGDKIKIGLRCTAGKNPNGNIWQLHVYIDPETCVAIDKDSTFLNTIAAGSYPDLNYTFFPVKNPDMLQNIPESLFNVDMNNIKEYHQMFGTFLNYYFNGKFPGIIGGKVNNISHILISIFSPAIYTAFIIKKLLSFIGFTPINNPFETDELKRLVLQTNRIINNYFWDNQPINLIDFLPETPLSDFFRNICRTLGIAFIIKTDNRTIRFAFIDDILKDKSAIPFSDNILSSLEIESENYELFSIQFKEINCEYTNKHYQTLDGLNVIGSVYSYGNLPETGDINDCYYLTHDRHYVVWQYNQETGAFEWIFYSIDFNNQQPQPQPQSQTQSQSATLKIDLSPPISANYFWDPDFLDTPPDSKFPAWDNTIGAPSFPSHRYWLTPAFFQKCNFKQLPDKFRSDDQSILLFYHGLHDDNDDNPYPFASNDVYDYAGDKITGADLALRLDSDYGLYIKKWKSFIDWRLDSPATYKFRKAITATEIAQLDWFRWHNILGVDYLLKEIRFNIRNNHLTIAEILAHRR